MKYLVLLLVFFGFAWYWRHNREQTLREKRPPKPKAPDKSAAPQSMLACAHCGTHIPEEEAIVGTKGAYCSQAHRAQRES